ncbi:RagB/SusD family nutrient uptake outer membrane protein [Pedobacter africanus]|nr:RagB/SusD family nutrient uptake outer membrane protein [Pedobacter africanus]
MNLNKTYLQTGLLLLSCLWLGFSGCKKFVEVPTPIDQMASDVAFDNDAKAASAVRGLYALLIGHYLGPTPAINAYGIHLQTALGVSADEMELSTTSNSYHEFYINTINSTNSANNLGLWGTLYNFVFNSNAVIENLEKSKGVTEASRKQFLAEARFMRAAHFFYLVNLYGDVPMPIGTDYRVNANLPRVFADEIYKLIVEDLKYAVNNLGPAYLGTQRMRANKYAACALLARVYLYREEWANAEEQAGTVIEVAGKTMYDMENDLKKTFLTSSKEVILQLQQPGNVLYTWDAYNFVPSSAITIPTYLLTDKLYQSFENGDLRKVEWLRTNTITTAGITKSYHYPYKYKISSGTGTTKTESNVFLRLSEQYLIRAEARAMQNKLNLAINDLDVIRKRSGISLIADKNPGATQGQLLALIMQERFVEFFSEYGHRWLDLKRTGKADDVLKDKPNWRPEAKLFPIPLDEINRNPFLIQNQGYN